ncbi:MAG: helix-turn-helix transcriptional regulator [Chloroflexi bacterium]|nr:helix-turn-helix transcriptional regulator [Chloroflexota bacterium]
MIIEYKTLDLFGKMVFERVILKPPFRKANPLPDEACMLYVIEGKYRSFSETEQLQVSRKEAVLMQCGNYLGQMLGSDASPYYEAVAVHFYPEVLKKIYENDLPGFLKRPLAQSNRAMAKLQGDALLQNYIDSILFLFTNPELATEDLLIVKVKELILLLVNSKHAAKVHQILANLFTPQAVSFREIVHAHLFAPLTTKELAQLTNQSLSSFKREFRKIFNASPSEYIKAKRMQKAAELLALTDQSITEIAYDCGFNDSAYFSAAFKAHYALSPSRYRLNQKNKNLS